METNCTFIPYQNTGFFSKLVNDYLAGADAIKPFIQHSANAKGIEAAIQDRQSFATNRAILVAELRQQYAGIALTATQENYLEQLLAPNTFTICTAHQPNIFTGHLYFIYKILHTIKLAAHLHQTMPQYNFVPVFYMGSEDADLDELGHVNINGTTLTWQTNQTGAVGRMKVDKAFIALMDALEGQLLVLPHGAEICGLFRASYTLGTTIQQATLQLVNALFNQYGLLVLIPDNANLKRAFQPIIEKELLTQFSNKAVTPTIEALNQHYKVQAAGRPINLFYLMDDKRERIEKDGDLFKVEALELSWTEDAILAELHQHPERFSANVILRGVFQETILPNVAFIGGGGEVAYWLELKAVFEAAEVPYPVVLLRNSFMAMTNQQQLKIESLGFSTEQFFQPTAALVEALVKRETAHELSLDTHKETLLNYYEQLQATASMVDVTLTQHVAALQARALKAVVELEKKILRAEKRKFETEQRQITTLKTQLFPNNSLQERVDNVAVYIAQYGFEWMDMIYQSSQPFTKGFGVVSYTSN
jgi:bacillithiol biosynthesis cysteine-adding enzyme BshC